MDSKLKNLMILLQNEKTEFEVLAKEISPVLSRMERNEQDRVFANLAFRQLRKKWIQLKTRCN